MDSFNDESRELCVICRELTPDEQATLAKYLAQSDSLCGMTGQEREMLYTLAMSTHMREDELASLIWEWFDLSDSPPSVTIPATYSTSGSDNVQQLLPEVAERFGQWQEEIGAGSSDRVFPNFDITRTQEMWSKDLYNAGVQQ